MAKSKISQYDATAANNTDVANINIAEGCSPSNINNAIRAVMSHLKDFQAGNQTGNALAVASGGTGAESASAARTNLGLGALATLATVDTAQIDDDAITTAKIIDNAVTNAKMADNSVDTAEIVDDAVTSAKIAANAVDATALNVSGDGTAGQVLLSDADGSFSWGDAITKTTGSAPYYGIRAWASITVSGTVSALSSGNVSSITDNAEGVYTVNFTTAMPDTNYGFVTGVKKYDDVINASVTVASTSSDTKTTSAVKIRTWFNSSANATLQDQSELYIAILR